MQEAVPRRELRFDTGSGPASSVIPKRFCAGVRTDAHTAEANVEKANEGYIATAELFAPDVRGSSEKYLMMRTDEDP